MGKQRHDIEEAEAILRETIQWLGEGVAVFDENGAILARNALFLRILGLSETAAALNLDDLIRETSGNLRTPHYSPPNGTRSRRTPIQPVKKSPWKSRCRA
jgi:PAS domain-containing protein